MKPPLVVVNIIGRCSFVAPLVQETTSGYTVRTSKQGDSEATEWFPKDSKLTRCGILREEEHDESSPK